MTKQDLDQYISCLKWDTPQDVFDTTIEILSSRDDYDLKQLVVPYYAEEYDKKYDNWKAYAEGCAKVICSKSDSQIINILPELFYWFQDLNWPGGLEIFTRLKNIPKSLIEEYRLEAICQAVKSNDSVWKNFLECM